MDGVRHRRDHIAQELRRSHLVGPRMEFGECELGRPVDGHEEIELAFGCLHFGNVDMEVSNGVALELLLGGLVALHLG